MNKQMKIFIPLSYSLICALFVTSCVSHKPDMKSPKPLEDIPDKWASWDTNISEPRKQSTGLIPLRIPWLTEAIRTAWSGNPTADNPGRADNLARGEEAVIIGANLSPQANLGVTGSRSKRNLIGFNLPNGSTSFTSNSFNAGPQPNGWEIDLWGKARSPRKSPPKNTSRGHRRTMKGARLSIAGQVAETWFEISREPPAGRYWPGKPWKFLAPTRAL